MKQKAEEHQEKVSYVRSALQDLRGHVKTIPTIQEHLFQKYPVCKRMNVSKLRSILVNDLHYRFGKPEQRLQQSQRDDVKLNRVVYSCFF